MDMMIDLSGKQTLISTLSILPLFTHEQETKKKIDRKLKTLTENINKTDILYDENSLKLTLYDFEKLIKEMPENTYSEFFLFLNHYSDYLLKKEERNKIKIIFDFFENLILTNDKDQELRVEIKSIFINFYLSDISNIFDIISLVGEKSLKLFLEITDEFFNDGREEIKKTITKKIQNYN